VGLKSEGNESDIGLKTISRLVIRVRLILPASELMMKDRSVQSRKYQAHLLVPSVLHELEDVLTGNDTGLYNVSSNPTKEIIS
jgi:hypothetical protein